MAFTHRVTRTVTYATAAETKSTAKVTSKSADAEVAASVSVPVASPDTEVDMELRKNGLKTLLIISDKDLVVETNDGTTPTDTINVTAGQAFVWTVDDTETNPINNGDVTKLFLTASGSGTATVEIRALQDSTP